MQKKVLLSLLATAPVAFTVSAHQNVSLDTLLEVKQNNDAWKNGGITELTYGDNTVTVHQPGSAFYLNLPEVWEQKMGYPMPAGFYEINFGDFGLAAMSVNDKEYDNGSTIEYDGKGEFTIKIVGIVNAHEYHFGKGQLTLKYNFEDEQSFLQGEFDKLPAFESLIPQTPGNPDNISAAYALLEAERATLTENIDALEAGIKAININATSIPAGTTQQEYYMEVYRKYELYNNPNVLRATLDQLKELIDEYNEKVKAENARYTIQETNQANMDNLLGQLNEYTQWEKSFEDTFSEASPYVQEITNPALVAVQDAIGALRENIMTAFFGTGDKINDQEVVNYDALTAALNDLADLKAELLRVYEKAIADQAAYNDWYNANVALTDYLNAAIAKLNETNDAEANLYKGDKVYTDLVKEAADNMELIVSEARGNFTIKDQEIHNAAEKLEQNLEFIKGAKTEIDQIGAAFQDIVDAQQAALAVAEEAAKAAQDALDAAAKALVAKDMSEDGFAKLTAEKDRIQGLIDEQKQIIETEYLKHDLTADDYSFTDILTAIDQLVQDIQKDKDHKDIADANDALVSDLRDRLQELKDHLAELFPDEPLDDIFDSTVKNIEDSIDRFEEVADSLTEQDRLVSDTYTAKEQYDNIVKNIGDTTKLADNLAAANKNISEELGSWKEIIDQMVEDYETKYLVRDTEGNVLPGMFTSDTWITPFKEKYQGFTDRVNEVIGDIAAGTITPQEGYDRLLAISADLDADQGQFAKDAKTQTSYFLVAVSQMNHTAVMEVYDNVNRAFQALGTVYPGKQEVADALAKVLEDLNAIEEVVTKGNGTGTNPFATKAELAQQDMNCQGAYNALVDIDIRVAELKANNEAYASIIDLWNNVDSALDDARAEIDAKTTEPARTYFLNIIDELDKKLDALKNQADADYKNIASVADETGVRDQLDRISAQIPQVVTTALANDAAHSAQLVSMKNLQDFIDLERGHITDYDQVPSDREKYLGMLDEVQAEYDQLVQAIADSFGAGTSHINNEDIMAKIDELKQKVIDIVAEMEQGYSDAVRDYNNNFVTDEDNKYGVPAMTWAAWQTFLNNAYRVAVNTYDEYHNSLQNPGFKEFMGDVITTHEGIYDYATPIRELIDRVRTAIETEFNQKNEVLTAEWLIENAINPAQKIYDDMTAEVDLMKKEANDKAQIYYESLWKEKSQLIAGAVQTMIDAGVSLDRANAAVAPMNSLLDKALDFYEIGTNTGNLCVLMGITVTDNDEVVGGIANLLDRISLAGIDMNGAAASQWAADYEAAQKTMDGYYNNLDNEYKDLGSEVREEYRGKLDAIQEEIRDLSVKATASEDMLADLNGLQDALEALLRQAADIDAEADQLNQAAAAENEAYENFKTDLGTVVTDFENLKAWAAGMAVEHMQDFSAIDAAVEKALNYINDNRGNLTDTDVATRAQALIDAARLLISNGYVTCYADELGALNELVKEAKRQFNEAFAGSDLTQEIPTEFNDRINALVEALAQMPSDINASDKGEVKTEALAIQKEAADIIAEIAGIRGVDNPAVGILADLESQYQAVDTQLESIFDGIADDVKAQFSDKVDELKAELEAVRDAFEQDGNNVIATGQNYTKDMNAISDAADKLKAEIDAAQKAYEEEQARQAASDAAADTLQAQLNAYKAEFEKFKNFVQNAGCLSNVEFEYTHLAELLAAQLENMQSWLDTEKAAYALTADSVLPGGAEFAQYLADAERMYALTESVYQMERANKAVSDAELLIVGVQHANQGDLEAKLNDLKDRLDALKTSADMDTVTALTEEVNAIVADAEALAEEAVENAFIYGDLDGDGKVTVSDLQEVLNLIADKTEYDPTNPLHKAADMNGDGNLNITDAIAIVQRIFGDPAGEVRMRIATAQPQTDVNVQIMAEELSAVNGTRRIAINLTNTVDFVGGQFDLKLPAGMQILSESLSSRTEGMSMVSRDNSSIEHRVVFISPELKNIDGSEGVVLELEVIGNGNIYVDNALFGDREGNTYEGTDPNTTGIDGIINNAKDGAQKIYDAAGRMMNKLQQGINIIVNGKGKGEKIYRKH